MMLVFRHPEWTADQIIVELVALGFDRPTSFLVSSIKSRFRADLKFLILAGVIDPDARPTGPLHPDLRKPKQKKCRRPDPPDLPYHHYYGGKDD